ncbi:MAG: formamidopyrimidine-DNA glycosylase [Gemmatimonadetes bacterium]|nr:formamidopyrimidine-DNA glycosylase [Gemmatimonadota bacterium]MYC00219.1 formamidopyrimidine-DNA glycosylase [Gemmatimonadota bacterium]MYI45787.1 formamidopyrimidine-DNA glycosylase [Gemmatimonadota bacterium]
MPELPEVTLYLHALRPRIVGERIERIRIASPSLLKTFDPTPAELHGRAVQTLSRLGKRIVLGLEDGIFAVIHLMIAGRFQWRKPGAAIPRKRGHAAFDFARGSLVLTEASTHKRASLHLVRGAVALRAHDPGGIEPLEASAEDFAAAILRENRTLKRALTDPRILSGIGNAHSDEILLRARLSPVRLTRRLSGEEIERLRAATRSSLTEWSERLIEEAGDDFPAKVTAFHPAMAAHGKYGEPCDRCGTAIQRIVYATRETNYCPACQTGGRVLADRALSRLLGRDWPRTVEELEELRRTPEPES